MKSKKDGIFFATNVSEKRSKVQTMSCIVYVMSMHYLPRLVHYAPLSAERDQTECGMLLPLNIQYQRLTLIKSLGDTRQLMDYIILTQCRYFDLK